VGKEWIERQNGSIDQHNGNDINELHPGDVFVMHTPSGGGFGTKN
jgi:N-methylhydantoinase B/oxoprolinase/acetone carboxylase alpha subunit